MSLRESSVAYLLAGVLALTVAPAARAAGDDPKPASPAGAGKDEHPTNTEEKDKEARTEQAAAAQNPQDEEDLAPKPAQPDFIVVNLPTTLRMPRFKSVFRLTHRFGRPLAEGSLGQLVGDLFGLDSGAQIGLEYRFGIMRGTQVGIHRTSNRTIEFFGQYDVFQQAPGKPVSVGAVAAIEGTNNFRDSYTPALGVVVSRTIGRSMALYAQPVWVNNTNVLPKELVDHNDTFFVGLGARIRVRPTVYVVGEFDPRVAGFKPGVPLGSFGIEKRIGGHVFQLNFSNALGTTFGQIARGGATNDDWFIGFNLTRKFF